MWTADEGPGPGNGATGASAAAPQDWQIASQPGRTVPTGVGFWGNVHSCAACGQLVQRDCAHSCAACVQLVQLCMVHEEARGGSDAAFPAVAQGCQSTFMGTMH